MSFARRVANLVAAVAQAAVPALGSAGLLGRTVDAQFQVIKTPVVPAGYAFSIWSLIFLFCLIYAVEQARPSRAADPLFRRIGWLTVAAFSANAIWSVLAQLQFPLVLTGLTFLVTFACMLAAAAQVFDRKDRLKGTDRWRVGIAVGALAAWVTVAIFANWSVILTDWGLGDVPSRTVQALAFLAGAGATAAVMIRLTRGALAYAVTIAWALVSLVVGNLVRGDETVAAACAALLLALVALTGWVRRSNSQRAPEPAAVQVGA